MTTQELRLGNWILPDKTSIPMRVVNLGADYLYLDFEGNEGDLWEPDMKKICGIPLTEELLLKCGFKKQSSDYEVGHPDYYEWLERNYPVIGTVYQSDAKDCLLAEINGEEIHIHYIHQLQNLFHALTGEELEINL